MHVIVTFHPLDAKSSAEALPTPLLPPVMIATGFSDCDIGYSFIMQSIFSVIGNITSFFCEKINSLSISILILYVSRTKQSITVTLTRSREKI